PRIYNFLTLITLKNCF
ncbi:putative tetratricopeptide repeat domain protein, partial [Chlamydia psittaci 84-8471/1]